MAGETHQLPSSHGVRKKSVSSSCMLEDWQRSPHIMNQEQRQGQRPPGPMWRLRVFIPHARNRNWRPLRTFTVIATPMFRAFKFRSNYTHVDKATAVSRSARAAACSLDAALSRLSRKSLRHRPMAWKTRLLLTASFARELTTRGHATPKSSDKRRPL